MFTVFASNNCHLWLGPWMRFWTVQFVADRTLLCFRAFLDNSKVLVCRLVLIISFLLCNYLNFSQQNGKCLQYLNCNRFWHTLNSIADYRLRNSPFRQSNIGGQNRKTTFINGQFISKIGEQTLKYYHSAFYWILLRPIWHRFKNFLLV